jgi:hypothetical protein
MILPRLMKRTTAASYLDVSPSKFDSLPLPRRRCGNGYLYDRLALDAFVNSLPYDATRPAPAQTAALDSAGQGRAWQDETAAADHAFSAPHG